MINRDILKLPELIGDAYKNAYPFPNTYIDNFMDPWVLKKCREEMDRYPFWRYDSTSYVSHFQVEKYYTPDIVYEPNDVEILTEHAPTTKMILDYMYSPEVVNFVSELTGIPDLLPDDQWVGAGVHKIGTGGKLGVHADFNINFANGLYRRVNILIYMNEHWPEEWGGNLELWNKTKHPNNDWIPHEKIVEIAPIFNRAAIFNITDDAFHGHPHPLTCPPNKHRMSLALYYYTKDRPDHEKAPQHPVIWYNT